MKNILTENLLRFGAKNLSHHDLYRISQIKLLKEEIGTIKALPNIDPTKLLADPSFKAGVDSVSKMTASRKMPFSIPNYNIWVAIAMFAWYDNLADYSKKWTPAIKSGNADVILGIIKDYSVKRGNSTPIADNLDSWTRSMANNFTEFQLNEHPDAKGTVLTVGTITATTYTPGDENGSSKISDIAVFLNDYTITNLLMDPNGAVGLRLMPNSSIIAGKVGTPGAGALDLNQESGFLNKGTLNLYSTTKFQAASASTTNKQTTTVLFTPGPELESDLGKQLFKTSTITPEATMAQKVKEAVDGAKSLGTITAVRIESGASFDRPVDMDNAAFAKVVGMAPNKVPANPRIDQQGIVKDPMSGGNAFLAYYRGVAIQNALGNQAGVTPTIVAKVEKGGDQAQYARIFFTIKKADNTTEITQNDVVSIGKGSETTDVSGQFKIIQYEP